MRAVSLAVALFAAGCAGDTALLVQLEMPAAPTADHVILTLRDGSTLVAGPLLLPADKASTKVLAGTQTARILLSDGLVAKLLTITVEGQSGGTQTLVGEASAKSVANVETTVKVGLQPPRSP